MLVYRADKQQFLFDVTERHIEDVIHAQYRQITGKRVGESELRSWRESLGRVASVLRDEGIPVDAGVAVEFRIPQSAKRIDVTLSGVGARNSRSAVIIELKQWAEAEATERDGVVMTVIGRGMREAVHPSYQAWSYAMLLEGFNTAVYEGGIKLHPCAYLHNYVRDGVLDGPHYSTYTSRAPLFLKGEEETKQLRAFIKRHIRKGDSGAVLDQLSKGETRPSKALADSLAKLLKGHPEFVLLDEQKTVYEAAIAAGRGATTEDRRVVIVHGGPGTGKSVIAVNLLVALTKLGLSCRYVSRNAAPRNVYAAKLTGSMSATRFRTLFSGSWGFIDAKPGEFDTLIVDEAHRLNEKSGLYGNLGENQVREIIAASKCAVFFLDEDQQVTLRDIGSREEILERAAELGAAVEEYELESQFRCAGSNDYLAWLDDTLGITDLGTERLAEGQFDFRVFDSPAEMHAAVEAQNGANKARVVAGYCWPWASKTDPRKRDVVIGDDYARRWNLDKDGSLWIIAPGSIDEVGCIHTCQGLELDYVGVIIGPDLIIRDGQVMTVPEARSRQDQTMKGYRRMLAERPEETWKLADRIIKNTYRTLMTRGMKGCYVYATDAETREYFRERLAE